MDEQQQIDKDASSDGVEVLDLYTKRNITNPVPKKATPQVLINTGRCSALDVMQARRFICEKSGSSDKGRELTVSKTNAIVDL